MIKLINKKENIFGDNIAFIEHIICPFFIAAGVLVRHGFQLTAITKFTDISWTI